MITVQHAPASHASSRAWPMGRNQWVALLVSYVGLVVVWSALGFALKGPLDQTVMGRLDRHVAVWFASHRTPAFDSYTVWGSDLAATMIKIIATAVIAVVLYVIWRSWIEPLLLALSLTLEAAAFITVTTLVGRPRPDVERLEGSPVNSSFPSGHTAAAAAYTAVAVVVFRHTQRRSARVVAVVVTGSIPVIVGLSRMYRGMHYLTDVLAGMVLGLVSVLITAVILRTPPPDDASTLDDPEALDDSAARSLP